MAEMMTTEELAVLRQQLEWLAGWTGGEMETKIWEGNRWWSEGVSEHLTSEFTKGNSDSFRTVLFDRGAYGDGKADPEILDETGVWKLVEVYSLSPETQCPGEPDEPNVATGRPCPLCEAQPGEEHGMIYLGEGWAEAIYKLHPHTNIEKCECCDGAGTVVVDEPPGAVEKCQDCDGKGLLYDEVTREKFEREFPPVYCPKVGSYGHRVSYGDLITFDHETSMGGPARVLGRVWRDGQKRKLSGQWLLTIATNETLSNIGIRYVNAEWVTSIESFGGKDADASDYFINKARALREVFLLPEPPSFSIFEQMINYGDVSVPRARHYGWTGETELGKLRVAVARLAQRAGLDEFIPGKPGPEAPFEVLVKCSATERGWNALLARLMDRVSKEEK